MEKKSTQAVNASPAIILVGAQLGENIGTVARAMLNFGLTDLRLVSPRAGWQMERAVKAAAGAEGLIDNHRLFDSVADATADLGFVVATTARQRDMVKPVLTPAKLAVEMRARLNDTHPQSGILFGCERTGLDNEDISLADAICSVPLNPDFSSLNLAQAVLLMGYEYYQAADETPDTQLDMQDARPATRGEINAMFEHMEAALDAAGFLAPPEKKPAMARNIRNIYNRAGLTEQDVQTLRGIINALLRWPRGAQDKLLKPRVAAISRGLADPEGSEKKDLKKDENPV
ncbi:MAG: RNA methyltransferase [Alphaproteobacteria bacterium]|nr:RNA methyltransferase [Alphaproteobacteria bacterium]